MRFFVSHVLLAAVVSLPTVFVIERLDTLTLLVQSVSNN